jgi:predicted transposase YbfD/YdcC
MLWECQKHIADKILSKKADYVLSLKENHPTLYHETALYFSDILNKRDVYEVKNKSKTDIYIRRCSVTDDVSWVPDLKKWKGLKSLAMIETIKMKGDCQTKEVLYFISSLESDPKVILNSVRSHWAIENNLHWILDVVFKEYDRILWDKNVIQNESLIRRFALNLIKQYKTKYNDNTAFKTIRKVLAMNDGKLYQILREF